MYGYTCPKDTEHSLNPCAAEPRFILVVSSDEDPSLFSTLIENIFSTRTLQAKFGRSRVQKIFSMSSSKCISDFIVMIMNIYGAA